MPQLWVQQNDQEPPWAVIPLDDDEGTFYLTGDSERPVAIGANEAANVPAYILRHPEPGGQDSWLLFAGSQDHAAVSVNGVAVSIGVRALRDKDEIRVGTCGMIFSTEQTPQVATFKGIGRPAMCPRCKLEIPPGTPAVRCPGCGVWHHQNPSADLPCWAYAEKCAALCGQLTSLEGGLKWAPEGL